jgi:hypothetical protein
MVTLNTATRFADVATVSAAVAAQSIPFCAMRQQFFLEREGSSHLSFCTLANIQLR